MYEFNVNVYGKLNLEVIAESKEDAERMVKEVIDNSSLKDILGKDLHNEKITVKQSSVVKDIIEKKSKDMER